MLRVTAKPAPSWTMNRLRKHFGMIPAERILLDPPPGQATEKDALGMIEHGDRICELVDGVLLEKTMGAKESFLAGIIIQFINNYLDQNDLGVALGEAGALQLLPGLVRVPDVSFISWDQLPEEEVPDVPALAPDLAVEVISKSNTKKEMDRKLRDYFENGSRLVWFVYPKTGTARVYTALEECQLLRQGQILDGGEVLPGFALPLAKLFAPRSRRGRR